MIRKVISVPAYQGAKWISEFMLDIWAGLET